MINSTRLLQPLNSNTTNQPIPELATPEEHIFNENIQQVIDEDINSKEEDINNDLYKGLFFGAVCCGIGGAVGACITSNNRRNRNRIYNDPLGFVADEARRRANIADYTISRAVTQTYHNNLEYIPSMYMPYYDPERFGLEQPRVNEEPNNGHISSSFFDSIEESDIELGNINAILNISDNSEQEANTPVSRVEPNINSPVKDIEVQQGNITQRTHTEKLLSQKGTERNRSHSI